MTLAINPLFLHTFLRLWRTLTVAGSSSIDATPPSCSRELSKNLGDKLKQLIFNLAKFGKIILAKSYGPKSYYIYILSAKKKTEVSVTNEHQK